MKTPFRLDNKVAIVTGAARGIGEAIVKVLAQAGAKVMVTDILQEQGQKVAEEINQTGGKAIFLKLDVTSEEEWKSVIQAAIDTFGSLDVLVNVAGIMPPILLENTSLKEFRRIHAINTEGVFLGIKHAILVMKPGGVVGRGGSIINISSGAGITGSPGLAAYCSSKAAVTNMTRAVAFDCAKMQYNIRINSVHPGVIANTGLVTLEDMAELTKSDGINKPLFNSVEEIMGFFGTIQPLGLGEPIDVAWAVLFLASDETRLMTGSQIAVDGGYLAT